MAVGEWIDFGTLRVFDAPGGYEYHFPRHDETAKASVRSLGGARWDPNRRCWKTPKHDPDSVVGRLREAYIKASPPGWSDVLGAMLDDVATTTSFQTSAGLGGVRLDMPRGHRHRKTLGRMGCFEDGPLLFAPPQVAATEPFRAIFQELVDDDRALLGRSVDDLAGFAIEGRLREGVVPTETTAIPRELVATAYTDMPRLPLRTFPMVVRAPDDPGGRYRFTFLTGDAAWAQLRDIGTGRFEGATLDVADAVGRWRMRSG